MKQTFIIISILIVAIIYFSCKSSTTSPTNPTGLTSITGTIENWSQGVQTLKLVAFYGPNYNTSVLASTQISATGSFNISLPATVNDSMLIPPLPPPNPQCSGNVAVNPANLKVSSNSLDVYQNDSIYIGYLSNASDTLYTTNSTYAYYDYFNATGTIKGNVTCKFTTDTSNTAYDMSFSQGWNPAVIKYTLSTPTYYTYTVNCTIPTGMKWWFRTNKDTQSKEKHFLVK